MIIVLIICAILFFIMQTIALKKIRITTLRENILTTGIFTGMIAIGFGLWGIYQPMQMSSSTVILGVVFGVLFIATIALIIMQCRQVLFPIQPFFILQVCLFLL